MTEQYKFWMVWSPQGRAPTMKHCSFAMATCEAERLANQHPTQEFYVLQAVRVCKRVTVQVVDLQEEPVPF